MVVSHSRFCCTEPSSSSWKRERLSEMEGRSDAAGGSKSDGGEATITVNVKFSGRTVPISISPNSTISDLKSLLLPVTNVLVRGQKLIFKGRVLEDSLTLTASDLTNGSKIMLMASQGLHQGDGPILKQAQVVPRSRRDDHSSSSSDTKNLPVKTSLERWTATGVIAFSQRNLKVIPDEVWACGSSGRLLDCSNNAIQDIPVKIGCLTGLQKLFLNGNELLDESTSWEGLTTLKHLTILTLDHNHLTNLPAALGSLTSLKELHVSYNKLGGIPKEIGHLTQLEVLMANNNRMNTISESIGNCHSLFAVDFSSNLLSELPDTFSNLSSLKALRLINNGIKSLPSKLFKNCLQLSTLDVHNTELTTDILREYEGWDDFDERRRSKLQKQLDFRAGVSRNFDEGADKK